MKKASLLVLVALCGCQTFSSYTHRSRDLPGAYDRAMESAQELGDGNLQAELEALGASHDFNGQTQKLAFCIDAYADGLRWERQSETGTFITKELIVARAKAAPQDSNVQNRAIADLANLKRPELQWISDARSCQQSCGEVIEGTIAVRALARDAELAAKYQGLCKTELADGELGWKNADNRHALADATTRVNASQQLAAKSCWLNASLKLDGADHQLAHLPNDEAEKSLRAQIAALRQKYAEAFARVQQFERDPKVIALRKQVKRVGNAHSVVQAEGDDARQAAYQDASDGAYSAANHDEAVRERASVLRADLEEESQELDASLKDLARQARIACPE